MSHKKRMNSLTGKKILELIRNGNYAHPGEEDAIELVFSKFGPSSELSLLDVGCGRGGTCEYLRKKGFMNITGIDIDEATIKDAKDNYHSIEFINADILKLNEHIDKKFDIIYMMTSFYALEDQTAALSELKKSLNDDGTIIIFDYSDPNGLFKSDKICSQNFSYWNPVNPKEIKNICKNTGLTIEHEFNIDEYFKTAYLSLVKKINQKKDNITFYYGNDWFVYMHNNYLNILQSIQRGVIGGILLYLKKY